MLPMVDESLLTDSRATCHYNAKKGCSDMELLGSLVGLIMHATSLTGAF